MSMNVTAWINAYIKRPQERHAQPSENTSHKQADRDIHITLSKLGRFQPRFWKGKSTSWKLEIHFEAPGKKIGRFFAESTPPADRKEARGSWTPQHHTNPASSPLAPHMFSKAFTKHKHIVMIVRIGIFLQEMFWSNNLRALFYSLILWNCGKMPKSYQKNMKKERWKIFFQKLFHKQIQNCQSVHKRNH